MADDVNDLGEGCALRVFRRAREPSNATSGISRWWKFSCGLSCCLLLVTACEGGAEHRDTGTFGHDDGGVDSEETSAQESGSESGGEEPQPSTDDDAAIISFGHPDLMACGQLGSASVVVRNTGATTWTPALDYELVAVGGTDPFSDYPRVALPEHAEVAPGDTWEFELSMHAPDEEGSHATSWQMARSDAAFGPVATGMVDVDCSAPLPEVPDRFDVVQAVAAEYGYLLEINTFESCGEFVQRVLMALADPEWGHVAKTSGEMQHTPEGFQAHDVDGHLITGFSHDVIYHRASNRQVDIIIAAAANSDENPEVWQTANIGWDVIPPEHYRENNPWIPAIAVE
jgi:hypothetical protein